MKVAYITDAFTIKGGLERVLTDKMFYLLDFYGYEVFLLTVNQGLHPVSYKLHTNVKHIDLDVRMHQQYYYHGVKRFIKRVELKRRLRLRIKDVINKITPNIIICVKLDFVGVLLDVKGKTPLIVESHTLCKSELIDGSGWVRRLHVLLWKKGIHKADTVVALTEGDATEWRKIHSHVEVIPNIVNLNKGPVASLDSKRIIWVGRFDYQKLPMEIVGIWKLVYTQYPDWHLDIYGEGEQKQELVKFAQSLNMNIHLHQPTDNIFNSYLESSFLVSTSLFEPFGLVLPEAMSCGLPVVAFDCPYGPAEIITDGVDGFLIKNRDIQAFADRVCQLIDDEELRRRMGQNGIVSSQRYRADVIMPKWINLFEKLLSSQ